MKIQSLTKTTIAMTILAVSSLANASLIEITYTGTVDRVDAELAGTFSSGDNVTGKLVYNTSTAPSSVSTTVATYAAIQSFELTIGSYTGSATEGIVRTYNDDPAFRDAVSFRSGSGLTGSQVGGLDLVGLQFYLRSLDLNTLTDLALPSISDLNQLWASNVADDNINFMQFATSKEVRYNLNTIAARDVTSSSVPVPAPLSLISLILAGLGYRWRIQSKGP